MSVLPEQLGREPVAAVTRRAPWGALDMLWAVLFGVLTALPVFLVVGQLLEMQLSRSVALVVSSGILYSAMALGVWLFLLRLRGNSWDAVGLRWVGLGPLAAMLPVFFGVYVVNLFVAYLVTRVVGQYENPQIAELAPGGRLTFSDLLWLLIAAAVIAPLAEELLFRGVLYRYLRGRMRVWLSALISAALFAVVHFIPLLLPGLFITGIVLALVAERYNSILPSIVLHALNNATSLLLIYVALNANLPAP